MKILTGIFLFVVAAYSNQLSAQSFKQIAVIGSSTAYGYGVPSDSTWANRVKTYYKSAGIIDTLYNIGVSSTDCYVGMPTGYVPPPGRSLPDPARNITKALSFIPKPDVIIVNYPTNNYDWLTNAEILNCLQTIKNTANAENVPCYITTTQPRESFSMAERQKLKDLKALIIAQFGSFSIDFWTDVTQEPDLSIQTAYALGDQVHLNSFGHRKLFQRVIAAQIFNSAINQPPSANAGNDIISWLPSNWAQLNGSGSYDPDGTIATYTWSRVSGPTQFSISNSAIVNPVLTNLVAGTYVFRLTVTDNAGAPASDDVTVNVIGASNVLPTANAGIDITMTLPTNSSQINGSGTDPDGTISTYSWTKISGPSQFTINNSAIPNPIISTLAAGTYVLRLTVTDNSGGSATDDINIIVNAQSTNQLPRASAGTDINSWLPGNWAQLNGSGSYDPDGTIATYAWSRVSGPAQFTISNPAIVNPVLTNLVVGTYVFRLTVTDNAGASASDDVAINVIGASNQLPTANAGIDITMTLPTNSSQLNGSGSDPDGTISTYSWTKISGPSQFTISNVAIPNPIISTLTAGTYVLRLTVTDNSGGTATDDINIVVNAQSPNQLPLANAGTDINSWLPGNWAQLNGNASYDPDGTIATYSWSKISGPAQFTISNSAIVNPVLTNLVVGTYVFRLTVTDNAGASANDNVTVNLIGASNLLPTANAGIDINMTLPVNFSQLNGSGTDPDGTISTYSWTKISGPIQYTISNTAIANPLISNLAAGTYVFRLTVTDNSGGSATDDINIIVNAQSSNQLPRANAGTDINSWLPGNWAQLNGSGSFDPDGTIATYTWSRVSGPTQFAFSNPAIVNPVLTNLVVGTYVFRLTVTDNVGASASDDVTVSLHAQISNQVPTVNAGADIIIFMPGNWARLSGTASDADGSISSYNWTQISGPAQYAISNADIIDPLLTNLEVGTYVFRLSVTDNSGSTASDDITIFAYSESARLGSSFFRTYPNPVRDNVLLELSGVEQGPIQVILTDINGKTIRNWNFQKTTFELRQSLNLSNITPGLYLLTIQEKNKTKTQKFIKQ